MKKKKEKKLKTPKTKTKITTNNNIKNFKQKYFDFYDDIKHYTNGKEDW